MQKFFCLTEDTKARRTFRTLRAFQRPYFYQPPLNFLQSSNLERFPHNFVARLFFFSVLFVFRFKHSPFVLLVYTYIYTRKRNTTSLSLSVSPPTLTLSLSMSLSLSHSYTSNSQLLTRPTLYISIYN